MLPYKCKPKYLTKPAIRCKTSKQGTRNKVPAIASFRIKARSTSYSCKETELRNQFYNEYRAYMEKAYTRTIN